MPPFSGVCWRWAVVRRGLWRGTARLPQRRQKGGGTRRYPSNHISSSVAAPCEEGDRCVSPDGRSRGKHVIFGAQAKEKPAAAKPKVTLDAAAWRRQRPTAAALTPSSLIHFLHDSLRSGEAPPLSSLEDVLVPNSPVPAYSLNRARQQAAALSTQH